MKSLKAKSGITLIALIITIVVLLILAGVSLNMILNGGLIDKAKQAVELSKQAQENEQIILNEYYSSITNAGLPENSKETLAGTIVQTPIKWTMEVGENISTTTGKAVNKMQVASVYAVATGNGETVPVPKGFYYVGGTINSGVVISDNKADQNKYANAENGDVPAGVAYNADGTVNAEKCELKGNQFVWIPVSINEYKKKDWGEAYANATWEKYTNSAELPQIEKYGGFYIGRYEAGVGNIVLSTGIDFEEGNMTSEWWNSSFSIRDSLGHSYTGKISEKAGEIPYYHADYETALKLSNTMYKTDYVQSGLVTGTQWDVMLKFIAGNNDTIVTSSDWGNYNNGNVTYMAGQGRYASISTESDKTTSPFIANDGSYHHGIKTTAVSEDIKKKNLYDVAGNLYEWTQEVAYSNNKVESYMIRGGCFLRNSTEYPAGYRFCLNATLTGTDVGFRPVLYIK